MPVHSINEYASRQLDNSEAIPAEFATSRVACSLGYNKCDMVMVSPDIVVGEVVYILWDGSSILALKSKSMLLWSATVDAIKY